MQIALVIETWNLGSARDDAARITAALSRLVARVRSQTVFADELVITHDGLDAADRAALALEAGRAITWVEVAPGTDYYAHKNHGFDATTAPVVAFTDGDCTPAPGWLEALTAPIQDGRARVVAGHTTYRAHLIAAAGSAVDFPYFASPLADGAVRGFFANNVAFERALFAARRFPAIPSLFHGQCQVLALDLLAEGVPVWFAGDARTAHAWPEGAAEWLRLRLLRGADTARFAPYLARTYAPRLAPAAARLTPLAGLALLAARAVTSTIDLRRAHPGAVATAAGLAFIAAVTAMDAVGAAAPGAAYRLCK